DLVIPIGDNRGSHSPSRKYHEVGYIEASPGSASRCASVRPWGNFASKTWKKTSAELTSFSATSQIVPGALYQIC
ncbi:MAG TPA: hypothetical protein VGG79_16820, partial [Roseiarcus sp.]